MVMGFSSERVVIETDHAMRRAASPSSLDIVFSASRSLWISSSVIAEALPLSLFVSHERDRLKNLLATYDIEIYSDI